MCVFVSVLVILSLVSGLWSLSLCMAHCCAFPLSPTPPTVPIPQLVMASDTLATVKQPVVVLTLHLQDADGVAQSVMVEMVQEQLDDFLKDLAHINDVFRRIVV